MKSNFAAPARTLAQILAFAALFAFAGCSVTPKTAATPATKLAGIVHGGEQPVTGARIQLYAVGSAGDGSASTALILTTLTTSDGSGNHTNSNANPGNALNTLPAGSFTITGDYICPVTNPEVYLTATGGNSGLSAGSVNPNLAMMAALGPCNNLSAATYIYMDELTTVASVAALAPFMSSYSAIGSSSSDLAALQSAFALVNQYTNTATGSLPGPALPAGSYASTYEVATLADAITPCIDSTGGAAGSSTNCGALFTDATPPSNIAPTDTIGALINIVNNPTRNVCPIYMLVPTMPPWQPALNACPSSWALPISALSLGVNGASSVYLGQTSQYTATVGGDPNQPEAQSVIWSVNGITGGNSAIGTISPSGLYTPPSSVPASALTVTATSMISSAAGSTSVTVLPVTVSVSGPVNVLFAQTAQYSAIVTGNSSQAVSWQVNGVTGGSSATGTISTSGLYMAPASAPSSPVTITAQSTAVSSASGTLALTISPTALSYATGDSRTVTQPTYPTICATLTAQFTSSQRSTPPVAASDDTLRIQAALSSAACKNTGKSVELAVNGSNNAFFSELITVTGEGLTIDSGVTLYGGANYSTQSELILINGANSSLNGPGTVDGRGDLLSGTTRLVQTSSASNLSIYNVTLQQSIYPNLYIQGGNGATIWGITILTPATRPNADGIDLDSLTNATVSNSTVEAGDDGVAVKTNASSASNITVTNNRFYGTHGISIGSQTFHGVTNILFSNNYLYGTDFNGNVSASANGVNIKTDPSCGGSVQQVTYQNTCLSGIKHLIILNTAYGSCSGTAGTPVWSDIIINGVLAQNSIPGAYSQFTGYSAAAPSNAALAYISLDSNSLGGNAPTQYATISLDGSSITPVGTGITTNTFSTPGSVPVCSF